MNKYFIELEVASNLYPITLSTNSIFETLAQLHSNYKFDKINYIADKHLKYSKDKAVNSAATPHISNFLGNKTSKTYAGMEV
ncbi:hypothetical protein BC351_01335 [Paenibacillus ferrarius]|uniref:Uncharacterized protein n=1 Tax=Paenibacillus ferrarius TaxID=1469647 RepID=A0A1V4HSV5_9BACL|nr:hypothetical protein [Paenibacillus ferrarius]OPH61912.1 hypothetical protein BC351_01335 [Paenibacillus ferrarius]